MGKMLQHEFNIHFFSSSSSSRRRLTTSFGFKVSGLKLPPEITIRWIYKGKKKTEKMKKLLKAAKNHFLNTHH